MVRTYSLMLKHNYSTFGMGAISHICERGYEDQIFISERLIFTPHLIQGMEFVLVIGSIGFYKAARTAHAHSTTQRTNLIRTLNAAPDLSRGPAVEVPGRSKHIYHCDLSSDKHGALIVELQKREKRQWKDKDGKDQKYYVDKQVGSYLIHEPSSDIVNPVGSKNGEAVASPIVSAMSDEYKFITSELNFNTFSRLQQFGIHSVSYDGPNKYREGPRLNKLYIYGAVNTEKKQINPETVSDNLETLLDELEWETNQSGLYYFALVATLFLLILMIMENMDEYERIYTSHTKPNKQKEQRERSEHMKREREHCEQKQREQEQKEREQEQKQREQEQREQQKQSEETALASVVRIIKQVL